MKKALGGPFLPQQLQAPPQNTYQLDSSSLSQDTLR